jgi:hypothetical protein
MAKIENNIFLYGVGGMIGHQLVVRQTGQGPVMAVAPRHRDKEPTAAQKAQHDKFRLALQYSKGAAGMPEYQQLAHSRHVSPQNVATADFLHPPEVHEIDLSHYTGKPGDVIEVRATDDVAVKTVGILIANEQNLVIEQGLMQRGTNDKTLWSYVATKDAGTQHVKVVVDAADLASQLTHESKDKNL